MFTFEIKNKLRRQVLDWEQSMDEKILNKQLQTGLLSLGQSKHEISPMILEKMRESKNNGVIAPYYGTFNCPGGASTFLFCFSSQKCDLEVKHIGGDVIKFAAIPQASDLEHCKIESNKQEFTFGDPDLEKYIPKEIKQPKEVSRQNRFLVNLLTRDLCFSLGKSEYIKLKLWKHWIAKKAFTTKYIYQFSEGSCYSGVDVTETSTNEGIDLMDYDNW